MSHASIRECMLSRGMEELTVELSIREAKARFTNAAASAARGERVVTKHGRPFAELVATGIAGSMDFAKAEDIRRTLGLNGLTVRLAPDLDDPVLSRQVLGLKA